MRVVLDTNVVLSALLWRGTPYRFLTAARQHEDWRIFTSPALLDELADVLTRPVPVKRLALIERTARQVLADYIEAVELVAPDQVPRVVIADPDDDHVIAAAVAAQADIIVSGDRHLRELGRYQNIRIINAAEAINIF